jgi:predicted dehydrogenase
MQQWLQVSGIQLAGFYDPDDEAAAEAEAQYGVRRYTSAEALLEDVNAVDIVTTTTAHFALAKQCLTAGKHVFIEKPLAHTLEEGQQLVSLVEKAGVKCQVGHVERYNPALTALKGSSLEPMFIEAHRLAQFNPRGTDVSVILDLMIHDIDVVLHLVKSPVAAISASGVAVMSDTPDIVNARIEFANGCVANLTASRISLKKMRKLRLFQRDAYIGIDFLDKKTEVIRLKEGGDDQGLLDFPVELAGGRRKVISVQVPEVQPTNAIHAELSAFVHSIVRDMPVEVPVTDGYAAMTVAHAIQGKMTAHLNAHNVMPAGAVL